MYKFLPVLADRALHRFENHQYLPFILNLFDKYKEILIDDYYPDDKLELVSHLIGEINQLFPWFLICLYNENPIGVVWVSHWHGGYSGKYHSCQIHSYIDKKYWGKVARNATYEFLNILFNDYKLKRIQMEIPEYNFKAQAFAKRMNFKEEGIIRCATIKDNKTLNHILFSILKGEFNNGKK